MMGGAVIVVMSPARCPASVVEANSAVRHETMFPDYLLFARIPALVAVLGEIAAAVATAASNRARRMRNGNPQ